jgi:cell division protein FtsZ
MSINLTVPDDNNAPILKPKLTVIGVGGAGGNAVNNMIRAELEGVDFVVANTDAQSLAQAGTERRVQLGRKLTQGLGAGSKPEIGRAAAEEAIDDILHELDGSHMTFIAAGMGGGTGTGGAPVIARAAREHGILTVGVVTKPFQFEGSHRMKQAEAGIEELEQFVDTLIVIPNQNLFRIANEKTTFADAFAMADEVLYSGVRGVTDLMVMPGLINLDFADIRSVMSEMGKAMMGTGEAEGERRALDAAEAAIANPLLDDTSMKGAKGVLINITGGMDITLFEVDEAANRIRAEVDEDAYIIVGSAFDESLAGTMRVSVVATGIDVNASQMALPTMLHLADQFDQGAAPRRESEPVAEDESESVDESKADLMPSAAELPAEAISEPVADYESEYETATEDESETESEIQSEVEEAVAEGEPETPPAAMPGIGATDAFIPPEPAEADETVKDEATAGASEEEAPAETENEAPEPAAEAPSRSRATSLFERVTGSGRAAFGRKTPASPETPEDVENKEISASEEAPAPAPDPAPEAVEPETGTVNALDQDTGDAETEQALGGMDPEDRLPVSDSPDDLLDIPAFLRRQAN